MSVPGYYFKLLMVLILQSKPINSESMILLRRHCGNWRPGKTATPAEETRAGTGLAWPISLRLLSGDHP
jgi:hypothetical protein